MAEIDGEPDLVAGERVLRAAAALAHAVTVDEVVAAIFEHAVRWLGGVSVGLWLLDEIDGVIRFAGGAGYVTGAPQAVAEIAVDSDLPAAIVVRTGTAVSYGSVEERAERWPSLAGLPSVHQAAIILRLDARERRLGCLSIGFPPRPFEADERATLEAVAEQCALAVDRALLYRAERRANDTLEFLADATAIMISALEPEEVVRRLVELAVPRFADSCAVFLARDESLVRLAVAIHAGGVSTTHLTDPGSIPIDGDHPLSVAYRTATAQPIVNPPETAADAGLSGDLVRALAVADVKHGIAVPLEAGGEVVGVMVVAWSTLRADTTSDRFALSGLAARAAVALTNARRFRHQFEIASMLVAAVLPAELPTPDNVDISARYIPATGAVAGDWYDALTRPDGQVVFGVGDASGHGLAAVATMAELRNAARGLAVAGMTPAAVLTQLSIMLSMANPDSYATAFYGSLDPATGRALLSTAGHVPPLLVAADQEPRFLTARGIPLGVAQVPTYADQALLLSPGSLLVAVSDGVIERRHESLDVGLERLRTMVAQLKGSSTEAIASRLVRELCADPEDDCCILIVRYRGSAPV